MEPGERPLPGRLIIDRYGNGGFRIGGEMRTGSVLLRPDRVIVWPVASLGEVGDDSLAPLFEAPPLPQIILFGTGARMMPVPAGLRAACRARGATLDAMGTGAACRTYNVLLGEGRPVAAALIAV
jgi:uncharacterized protein